MTRVEVNAGYVGSRDTVTDFTAEDDSSSTSVARITMPGMGASIPARAERSASTDVRRPPLGRPAFFHVASPKRPRTLPTPALAP